MDNTFEKYGGGIVSDFTFGEGVFATETLLKEKVGQMELIRDAGEADKPIVNYVELKKAATCERCSETTIEGVSSWIKDINPGYDPFNIESPYNVNCGACAYAVYQRMNGNTEIKACEENIGSDALMENVLGMKFVSMSPKEIEECLLEQGDGAHAVIGVDRAAGSGHWFNAACLDGKVVAIDGQSGEIHEWPPDYGNVVNWEIALKENPK